MDSIAAITPSLPPSQRHLTGVRATLTARRLRVQFLHRLYRFEGETRHCIRYLGQEVRIVSHWLPVGTWKQFHFERPLPSGLLLVITLVLTSQPIGLDSDCDVSDEDF